MRATITVLPGDGIGPEVTAEAVRPEQGLLGLRRALGEAIAAAIPHAAAHHEPGRSA